MSGHARSVDGELEVLFVRSEGEAGTVGLANRSVEKRLKVLT